MNRERTCINTDKEIWRKIKDDFYSPSIHITEKGGIGINVGGRVIVLPVEKWHELADRITAEENQLQNKEPIFYDCTLAKFAEQMNVPLYKAMEFGKYFRIIAEEGKDNLMLTERIAQITAHRVCCGSEHNPQEGKFHGYCVVCGVPFPCEYVGVPPTKQPQQPKLPEKIPSFTQVTFSDLTDKINETLNYLPQLVAYLKAKE